MNQKTMKQLCMVLCLLTAAMLYTGCGNQNRNNTSNGNGTAMEGGTVMPEANQSTGHPNTSNTSAGNDDNQSNVGQNIGDAASDVAEGVGNAVDDLAGVDYSDYNSAYEYLLEQIGGTDSTSKYEVRNKSRDLHNYNSSDSTRKGYRFEVYDTSQGNGKKYGVFYVDQETGKIYKERGTNQVEEYKTK